MEEALAVSCNGYFAQLGRALGWPALREMGRRFDIPMGDPRGEAAEHAHAIESAYGQAQVVATPLAMARVAATMAAGGRFPPVHVVRKPEPGLRESSVVSARTAGSIARMMRGVVERGTARRVAGARPAIAGKTGTAEVAGGASHAWFIGYAPYAAGGAGAPPSSGRRIAFCIMIENGGYGGGRPTELAGRIVAEAHRLGLL
jgi:cell division protein FtsI/penicillin-binding protein 2